ncbi:MAG: restriction endonuclease subunit S [Bacteroidetes bacterium]|nr:restriction endonuclease subunit S [Bacteroidota bacterium]
MKLKYSKYKSSGVEWIDEIPSHWMVNRIGFVSTLFTGFPWKSELFDFNEGIKIVRGENVSEGFLRWGERTRYWKSKVEEDSIFYLKKGDIIISMDGSKVGKNFVLINENDLPLLLHQRMCRVRVNHDISESFICYFIGSEKFKYYIDITKTDPMIPHITQKDIFNFKFSLPPIQEQNQIVKYLDEKTTQIDNLISITEKKIETLKEKRTSLINTVVTKGLNPKVKFKESGVEWIGDIPEHWERTVVKRLVSIKLTDGPHTTPNFIDSGVPFISVESIKEDKIDFDYKRGYISVEDDLEYSKKSNPKRDDILLVKSGSTTGKVTIVDTDENFNIWSPLCLIRPKKEMILPMFMFYSMKSEFFQLSIQQSWSFGTQPNIGMGVIENLFLVIPTIKEQEEIVKYIQTMTNQIDDLISIEKRRIETIKEYRQSLISEVVTGKVRVCEEDPTKTKSKPVLI